MTMRTWMRPLVTLALIVWVGQVFAQFTPTVPTPSPVTAPNELSTPRRTLSTLLDSVRRDDGRSARRTLVLDSIPLPLRETEGTRRARLLAFIIDRTRALAIQEVPDLAQGTPYTYGTYQDVLTKQSLGSVVIERQPDGAWRFSSETVDAVPQIYASLENAPSKAKLGIGEKDLEDPHETIRSKVPLEWRAGILGLEIWQWIGLAVLIGISLLAVPIVRFFVRRAVRVRVPFIRENVTETSESGLKASVVVIVLATIWRSALPLIALPIVIEAAGIFVLRVMGGLALAWLLIALFDAILDVFGHVGEGFGHRTEHILIPVVRKFGKSIILFGTALFIASALDLNLAGVVAGLGIGGLVLALAAKDSVENLFGSLTILFDMPFGVGDWVKVGTADGTVEQINLRSTRIRTGKDSVITLPNSNLIKASVENMGQRRFREFKATLRLEYGTPPDKIEAFCAALREMLDAHPQTRKKDNRAAFHDFGENSMDVVIFTYFETKNFQEETHLRHETMLEILRIAERTGVLFAPAASTVILRSDEPHPSALPSGEDVS